MGTSASARRASSAASATTPAARRATRRDGALPSRRRARTSSRRSAAATDGRTPTPARRTLPELTSRRTSPVTPTPSWATSASSRTRASAAMAVLQDQGLLLQVRAQPHGSLPQGARGHRLHHGVRAGLRLRLQHLQQQVPGLRRRRQHLLELSLLPPGLRLSQGGGGTSLELKRCWVTYVGMST